MSYRIMFNCFINLILIIDAVLGQNFNMRVLTEGRRMNLRNSKGLLEISIMILRKAFSIFGLCGLLEILQLLIICFVL